MTHWATRQHQLRMQENLCDSRASLVFCGVSIWKAAIMVPRELVIAIAPKVLYCQKKVHFSLHIRTSATEVKSLNSTAEKDSALYLPLAEACRRETRSDQQRCASVDSQARRGVGASRISVSTNLCAEVWYQQS